MAKTFMDQDMDAELEGMEDSDEEKEEKEDDSDDDMDDNDDEFDEETLKKISELEAQLAADPYNYTAHTQLIDILRKGGDFTKLRSSREAFSKCYPLSAELWIQWAQDEVKMATTEEEKKVVVDLFERGVKDYVSVDLWLEYCQFSIGGIGTTEGIEAARSVYERSLTACGLHASKGALLWESFREFEAALLSLQGTPSTDEQKKSHAKQKERIQNLFRRQLRIPHLDMDGTLAEYKEFMGTDPDANVSREFQKAKDKLKQIQPHEVSLSDKDSTVEDYREYLKIELKAKDPARVQLLYERAVTSHCLDSTVWEEYLNYLDTNLRIDTVSLPVYERAVRNCPWSQAIWTDYIRALERYEKDPATVVKVFEESLAVGFGDPAAYLEVWLAFVDFSRRRTEFSSSEETQSMAELRAVLDRACDHLASVSGDPECEMLKYYANLEADQFRKMENARKIWADILAQHQFKASLWMEAIQFEKIFGDKKHLRKRYERALEKAHDDPESIAKSWLQFEREEGSLEAFDHCRKAINIKMEKMKTVREKENRSKGDEELNQQAKIEKKKEKDKQYRRDKRQQISAEKKSFKEPSANGDDGFKMPAAPPPAKKVAPPPGYKPPPGGAVEPPPGYRPPGGGDGEEPSAKRPKVEEVSTEERKLRTVFVSNLSFDTDEETLASIMGKTGRVREVRLVRNRDTNKSKGYAFVEFEDQKHVAEARKRDNELLEGRPMYVSECDPDKKGPVFKYQTGMEKKKLFVKGLDLSVTKEELVSLFSEFGELADVRLVTYRNGHSKGLAFVDFKEEVGAAKALIKTDGMKIKKNEIQVAISNPPARKDQAKDEPADVRSLGGTQQREFGPRGKGRSMLAFTPRSVAKSTVDKKLLAMKFVRPAGTKAADEKKAAASEAENSGEDKKNGDSTNTSGEPPATNQSKSNSDFRNMILGSK